MSQTYYISLAGIIPLFALYMYFEQTQVNEFFEKRDAAFIASLTISAMVGFFIVISINLNNTINSPMSVAVTGEVKGVVGTGLGLLVYGDVIITKCLITGLAMGSLGSAYYSYVKFKLA